MTPKILQETTIHQGWGRYLLLKIAMPDGAEIQRQLDDHGDAACLLPYDPERRTAVLVRLWRVGPLYKGQSPFLLEAPAGLIDPGEAAEACARRESMEETGVRLGVLEPVARVWSSPGVCSERIDLYLAPYGAADRIASGGGLAEEHEGIEVVETPLAELWRKVCSGEVCDMKTLVLTYALKDRRPDLF